MPDPDPKSWHDNLPFPKRWLYYVAVKIIVLAIVLYTALKWQGLI
jgi:hypothetical protein